MHRRPEAALLVNVSVSGAAVLAADRSDLRIGSRVTISFEDTVGVVIIRRISPCGDRENLYGIEFAEPMSGLTSLVYERFLRDAPQPQPGPGERRLP